MEMKNNNNLHITQENEITPKTKKNRLSYFQTDKFKQTIGPEMFRIFIVVVATLIYGIGLSWFLEVSVTRMYAGGIPGVAQLIVDLLSISKWVSDVESITGIIMFVTIIVLNIPIILLGWFGVSKRFTIYSIISVILQATIIGFIKIEIFKGIDDLMLAIFGGSLVGVGVGISMKFGTSTGGFDIISQYLSLKRGRSVGQISTIFNFVLMLIGAIALGIAEGQKAGNYTIGANEAGKIFLFSLVRLFATMILTDKIHTAYNYLEFNIITDYAEDMVQGIIEEMYRGATIFDARGGYAFNEKSVVYLIVMNFERAKLLAVIKRYDPNAFIVMKPVSSIHGNFSKKTVA